MIGKASRFDEPGVPFPMGPSTPEVVIAEHGNFDDGDGIRVTLTPDLLIFHCHMNGAEGCAHIDITRLLTQLGEFTRAHES